MEWCNLNKNKDLHTNHDLIDWKQTIITRNLSKMTSGKTNPKDHTTRTFRNKLFCNELATMLRNHKRTPKLYKTEKCTRCNEQTEDQIHVFLCRTNPINITTLITETIAERSQTHIPNKREQIQHWHNTQSAEDLNNRAIHFINNLIPKELTRTIKLWNGKNNKTSLIIKEVSTIISHALKTIWIQRCKDTLIWEEKNNITKKMKKDKTFFTNTNTAQKTTKKNNNATHLIFSKLNIISFFNFVYNKLAIDNVDTGLV